MTWSAGPRGPVIPAEQPTGVSATLPCGLSTSLWAREERERKAESYTVFSKLNFTQKAKAWTPVTEVDGKQADRGLGVYMRNQKMRELRAPLPQVRDDSFGSWREDESWQDLVLSGAGEVSVGSQSLG